MISTDENIKMLSRAVLDEAHSDAEKVLAEARTKAEELRIDAQQQANDEKAKILDQAALGADRVSRQGVAIAQLKTRTLELEQRETLIENVFEVARQRLESVQTRADYEEITERLLREALSQLGSLSVKVRADPETQKLISNAKLKTISADLKMQIQLGESLKQGTGLIVETEDGRRQYDNTIETRLKRLKDVLRGSVYHILMGEKL